MAGAFRGRRLAVSAVFNRDASRVDIGGQVFGEDDRPMVGADVVIRASWGIECTTTSTALGSFGARFTAPADVIGREIAIEANGLSERLTVQ